MPGRLILIFSLVVGLSGCASGLNWFSGGSNKGVVLAPEGGWGDATDPREVVAQISEFKVMRTPGGAILQAVGLPPRQGYWNAELVPENDERPVNGVLTYVFRIAEPPAATRQGTPYSRRVFVAHFVSDTRLAGVRAIRVVGANNSMVARR